MSNEIEATKIIPNLGDSLILYVLSLIYKKGKSAPTPLELYQGEKVYSFGDKNIGYVALVVDEKVVYLVRHKEVRANGFRLGRQVLLWRYYSEPKASGFAEHVFNEILLPKYTALISDTQQTDLGKTFWQSMLRKSFDRPDRYAYYLDRRSTPVRLLPLSSMDDVKEFSSELWGSDEGHLRTFAVISLKPLSLKNS
jgi:hypothetical protein